MKLTPSPFYYIRHGQTDWNAKKLCVGQVDVPLNVRGITQARAVTKIVQGLELSAIFYSPLKRAQLTAMIVSDGLKIGLLSEPDLREVCLGIKEGQPEDDPSDDFISAWLAGAEIQGAEPFSLFRARVTMAVNRCLSPGAEYPPLLVAHSGVFMALASACGSQIDDIEHCRPYYFKPLRVGWSIHRIGQWRL